MRRIPLSIGLFVVLATLACLPLGLSRAGADEPSSAAPAGGQPAYASVNGLRLYYEVHGSGPPLVTLHRAFGRALVLPELAKTRRLIAVELQGHGHTADNDRALAPETMADDVGALLAHLKIDRADVFGYSMGGNVALALAIKHPQRVRKLATYGSNAGKIDLAYEAEAARQFKNLPPDFAPPPLKSLYDAVAPNPQDWPRLIAMVKQMGLEFSGFSNDKLKSVKAQVLVAVGDRDVVRPEHAVEMFRQMPNAQLCVVPGADHFLPFQDPQRLLKVIEDFLATPVVAPPAGAVPKP